MLKKSYITVKIPKQDALNPDKVKQLVDDKIKHYKLECTPAKIKKLFYAHLDLRNMDNYYDSLHVVYKQDLRMKNLIKEAKTNMLKSISKIKNKKIRKQFKRTIKNNKGVT